MADHQIHNLHHNLRSKNGREPLPARLRYFVDIEAKPHKKQQVPSLKPMYVATGLDCWKAALTAFRDTWTSSRGPTPSGHAFANLVAEVPQDPSQDLRRRIPRKISVGGSMKNG